MSTRDGYIFYEAGQAVAAVYLGLTVRHVSVDPAHRATEIVIPRQDSRARMILWLTGMAAEKKGAGKSDPLRQMRTRQRVRATIDALTPHEDSASRRKVAAHNLLNQAQDRANAICASLFPAIREVATQLREKGAVTGEEVKVAVLAARRPVTVSA